MYAGNICVHYVDANKYTLAHILQCVGDKMGYTYDFGDKFIHNIELEEIKPIVESDGSVIVIEGRGMCPPEDGQGNRLVTLIFLLARNDILYFIVLGNGLKTFAI